MATTYRTPQSKYWFARYSDGSGKRISKSTKTESRREAKRIAADFESAARKETQAQEDPEIPAMIRRVVQLAALELQQGRLTLQRAEELIRQMHQAASPDDTGTNFRRFAGAWLDTKDRTAATTWRSYRDAIKATNDILGKKADGPMRQLTVTDMELVQAGLTENRRGRTVNYYFGVVRRILESAVQKDLIHKNPARPVKGIGEGDSVKRAEFTTDEVRRILAHAKSQEWFGLILLGAQTGQRRGDLLRWTSDNIVGDRIQTLASKTSNDSNEVLQIPLRQEALQWLKGRTGDLFPTLKTKKDTALSSAFMATMKAAGVANVVVLAAGDPPVLATRSFHSLRHTFNSWLAEADVHSDVRQKLTGHKSAKVHAGYTHLDKALDRAVATLPDL